MRAGSGGARAMVEGWCSLEELTLWGFGCSRVVMAHEAHSGLARCIRTREAGVRIIQAAHQAGVCPAQSRGSSRLPPDSHRRPDRDD